MASAKCNELVNRASEAKNMANQAFQQLARIRGLVAQTEDLGELNDLQDRRSNVSQLANDAAKLADALLQQAKQNNCGAEVEGKIEVELNYARNVFNQLSTIGGDIAFKIKRIEDRNKVLEKEKQAEADAKDSEKASTTKNNAGTGTPGTAGSGATATPDAAKLEEIQVTAKRKPEQLEEVQVTGVKKDTTGLDEVQVTGKRSPDALEEVQVTGKRSPDGLEEVTVTGKRATDPAAKGNNNTVPGIKKAQAQAVLKDTTNFTAKKDWRVRLSLSPGANYLYKAQNPGILAPLLATDGVLFPYTPSIQVSYTAGYDSTQLTHSNYKFFQYTSSNVDNINLTCDFTAQDTYEANYLLAVIHFFRSATKMFYGQDENPKPGTPPPLCYLFGLGEYQFNAHPLAITNFSYSLPNNVDYIRAGFSNPNPTSRGINPPIKSPEKPKILDTILGAVQQTRLVQGVAKLGKVVGLDIIPGGGLANPSFQNNTGFNSAVPPGTSEPTYVPTSIQISISCVPIVSRYDISNTFSLRDYATGELLRGVKRSGGGIW